MNFTKEQELDCFIIDSEAELRKNNVLYGKDEYRVCMKGSWKDIEIIGDPKSDSYKKFWGHFESLGYIREDREEKHCDIVWIYISKKD